MRDIASSYGVHYEIIDIRLEIEIITDHMIEKACLPKTLLPEVFRG